MTRRTSSSRPMTGSSFPLRAWSVRFRVKRSSDWYCCSGDWSVTRWPPRTPSSASRSTSAVTSLALSRVPGRGALLRREAQHEVLGGDVRVLERLGLLLGAVEHLVELAAEGGLAGGPLLPRQPRELALQLLLQGGDVQAGLLEQRLHHPFVLRQQRREEMGVIEDRIAAPTCIIRSVAEGFLCLQGQSFGSQHGGSLGARDIRAECTTRDTHRDVPRFANESLCGLVLLADDHFFDLTLTIHR